MCVSICRLLLGWYYDDDTTLFLMILVAHGMRMLCVLFRPNSVISHTRTRCRDRQCMRGSRSLFDYADLTHFWLGTNEKCPGVAVMFLRLLLMRIAIWLMYWTLLPMCWGHSFLHRMHCGGFCTNVRDSWRDHGSERKLSQRPVSTYTMRRVRIP